MKYKVLCAIIMVLSSFLAYNAFAGLKPDEKDYAKSLKELCYYKTF